jgi:hypothetical protein
VLLELLRRELEARWLAEPPETAKLKSILNQELGPLIAQQKSQLSVAVASQAINLFEFRVRTSGMAHDQHS